MTITINSQTIDYTLEHESTLGDVVGAIERWLGEAGMQIRSVEHDGNALDISERSEWDVAAVADIGQVDIVAVTPAEFLLEKIQSLHAYFTAIRDEPEDSTVTGSLLEERVAVGELIADGPHVVSIFHQIGHFE